MKKLSCKAVRDLLVECEQNSLNNQQITEHLETCAECARFFKRLQETVEKLKKADIACSVLCDERAFTQGLHQRLEKPARPIWVRPQTIFASILLVGLLTVLVMFRNQNDQTKYSNHFSETQFIQKYEEQLNKLPDLVSGEDEQTDADISALFQKQIPELEHIIDALDANDDIESQMQQLTQEQLKQLIETVKESA